MNIYSNFMAWLLLTRHLWQFEPLILLKKNNIRSNVITFMDLIFTNHTKTSIIIKIIGIEIDYIVIRISI